MSYPLITGEQVIGALNMYAFRPLAPDVALQARAAQLADPAPPAPWPSGCVSLRSTPKTPICASR